MTYLDAAFMGPLPIAAQRAGRQALRVKGRSPWRLEVDTLDAIAEAARAAAAKIIHTAPDNLAIIGATSYGTAIAVKALPVRRGSAIILRADEHPSMDLAWRAHAALTDAVVVTARRPISGDWAGSVLEAIAGHQGHIAVVATATLDWLDGGLVDVGRIAPATRARGAALVVDGTQSIGAVPFDLRAIDPDFLIFAAYKWLVGPYGLAFLYAAPRWHDSPPLEHNAWNHRPVGGFTGRDRYTPAPAARRFDRGERSDPVALASAGASLRLIARWTPERIAATIAPLTERIAAGAARLGLTFVPAKHRAPHIIGLRKEGGDAAATAAALARMGIHVSARGGTLRVSPHVYNDDGEIELFLRRLEQVL